MGCDIHAMKESKESWGCWKNEGEPEINRDYELFSVLAGVRNQSNNIVPISNPKGINTDASEEFRAWIESWDSDAHSASWLTLKELKDFDQNQEYTNEHYITERNEDGSIKETIAWSSDPKRMTEKIGKVKVFSIWKDNPLNKLIDELEEVRKKRSVTDEEVRICFFFDN